MRTLTAQRIAEQLAQVKSKRSKVLHEWSKELLEKLEKSRYRPISSYRLN
jgi:hypothetical protein